VARKIDRTPRARLDLIEVWQFVADDNEAAADRMLDRVERCLATLSDDPLMGRARPELAAEIRSFPVGSYVLFYFPARDGIVLVRVRNGSMDTRPEDMSG
jgi:toxin ParE1/3/4